MAKCRSVVIDFQLTRGLPGVAWVAYCDDDDDGDGDDDDDDDDDGDGDDDDDDDDGDGDDDDDDDDGDGDGDDDDDDDDDDVYCRFDTANMKCHCNASDYSGQHTRTCFRSFLNPTT